MIHCKAFIFENITIFLLYMCCKWNAIRFQRSWNTPSIMAKLLIELESEKLFSFVVYDLEMIFSEFRLFTLPIYCEALDMQAGFNHFLR